MAHVSAHTYTFWIAIVLFLREIFIGIVLFILKSSHLPKKKRTIIVLWCHFAATTRILQFVVSLCKSGLYFFIFLFFFTNLNKKAKTKWILAVVVKYCHCGNGLSSISWMVFSFNQLSWYFLKGLNQHFVIFGNFVAVFGLEHKLLQ